MKAAVGITRTHNPFDEDYWASCLRENLTSSSYGEGLETGREFAQEPRQSFTRQLFFKWIKQHLRIKSFFGTSETAVKTQRWIAVSVYLIVAIIKKRLNLHESLYTISLKQEPQIHFRRRRGLHRQTEKRKKAEC